MRYGRGWMARIGVFVAGLGLVAACGSGGGPDEDDALPTPSPMCPTASTPCPTASTPSPTPSPSAGGGEHFLPPPPVPTRTGSPTEDPGIAPSRSPSRECSDARGCPPSAGNQEPLEEPTPPEPTSLEEVEPAEEPTPDGT